MWFQRRTEDLKQAHKRDQALRRVENVTDELKDNAKALKELVQTLRDEQKDDYRG